MIRVRGTVQRQLFNDPMSGYSVYSIKPYTPYPEGLVISKYGTISISGEIEFRTGTEVDINVILNEESQYEGSYFFCGFGAITMNGDRVHLNETETAQILAQYMTESQVNNVMEAYPDFIDKVLNGEKDQVDYKKIYNVGKKRILEYFDKIEKNCRDIIFFSVCADWGIKDAKLVSTMFDTKEQFVEALEKDPYEILCGRLGMEFIDVDPLIVDRYPAHETDYNRCLYDMLSFITNSETTGSTRINTEELLEVVKDEAFEAVEHFEKCLEDVRIHYEDGTVARQCTYEKEKYIAEDLKRRLAEVEPIDVDETKFFENEGMVLSDEQRQILSVVKNNGVAMLTGGAGCVDCDTEFFNGKQWKPISQFDPTDLVLQYNDDGTATLVKPNAYIKEPCEEFWHFETKYGLNQTLSDEHNVVWWSEKGKCYESKMSEIVEKHNNSGWNGRIETSFNYGGSGINLTDAEIKLMCAIICDGSFYYKAKQENESYDTCRFHIKKERKKIRLRELFAECGLEHRETESANKGYTDFYVKAPIRTKVFDDMWYNCSNHQLQIICDNIIFWDGNVNPTKSGLERRRYCSNVKQNAEFIQFAFSACGYKATLNVKDRTGQEYFTCGKLYERKSIEYNVSITNRTRCGLCNDHGVKTTIERVKSVDGYKYCFNVPSHKLVLRRANKIFITGNCGKSFTTRAVVDMLESAGLTVTLLAPTGIASRRLREATLRPASTIHMMLAKQQTTGDVAVIDEVGMVSVELLFNLLRDGTNPDTRIVFVCDPAQLVSISCGNIAQDLMSSGSVPIVNLTKVFRYGTGGIATVATDIRNGKKDSLKTEWNDYNFADIGKLPMKQIVDQYQELLDSGYKPKDILVLTPFNKGTEGTVAINNQLQKFNPNELTEIGYKAERQNVHFKIGDKVINKKNNYHACVADASEEDGEDTECFIANGEIGFIRDLGVNNGCAYMTIEFTDNLVYMCGKELENIKLGYSLTVHSCQGCEAKAVIMVMDSCHSRLATRNLLYVGCTRAKERLSIIGNAETISGAIDRVENLERNTWLGELLKEN